VAGIAVEKGCQRFEWAVLDWNTPAIEFYRAMGAEFMDEWRIVRLTGEALMQLGGRAPSFDSEKQDQLDFEVSQISKARSGAPSIDDLETGSAL